MISEQWRAMAEHLDEDEQWLRPIKDALRAAAAAYDEQKERIAALERALEFYADDKHWINDVVDIGVGNESIPNSSACALDGGDCAIAALARVTPEEQK